MKIRLELTSGIVSSLYFKLLLFFVHINIIITKGALFNIKTIKFKIKANLISKNVSIYLII